MQKGKDDFMKIQKEKTVIIKKSYICNCYIFGDNCMFSSNCG